MQTLVEPPELGLPDELWLQVLLILGVEDVIRMRGTSKRLLLLTQERTLWMKLMSQMILERQLPPPASPLQLQTANEIERHVVQHLRYRKNLIRGTAKLSTPRTQEGAGKFTGHFLVPGGQWLLTAADNNVLCWRLSDEQSIGPVIVRSCEPMEGHRVQNMDSELHNTGAGATLVVSRRAENLSVIHDFFSVAFTEQIPQVTHQGTLVPQQKFFKMITLGSFALGVSAHDWGRAQVALFEWEKAISGAPFRRGNAILSINEIARRLGSVQIKHLLPDHRIVACKNHAIAVFAPPSLQEAVGLDLPDEPFVFLELLWSFSPSNSMLYHEPLDQSTLRYLGDYRIHSHPNSVFRLLGDGHTFDVFETQLPPPVRYWRTGCLSGLSLDARSEPGRWILHIFTREPIGLTKDSTSTGTLSISDFKVDAPSISVPNYDYDELSGRICVFTYSSGPSGDILSVSILDLQ